MKETLQRFDTESLKSTRLPSASCIIIDGDTGAGKSTLAGQLANDLGFKVISLDDYLRRSPIA